MSKETNTYSDAEIVAMRNEAKKMLQEENAYLTIVAENEKLKAEIEQYRLQNLLAKMKRAELSAPPKEKENSKTQ